jgi:hypothetical protein
MIPKPMPHPNDDPDFQAARTARQTFEETADRVRQDFNLSDLAKAERITAAWDTYKAALDNAYKHLITRRRARLEHLESLIPVGPVASFTSSDSVCPSVLAAGHGRRGRGCS